MSAIRFLLSPARRLQGVFVILSAWGALAAGCQAQASAGHAVGDPARGSRLVDVEACGSCHVIPGHAVGTGQVGPPLTGFGRRTIIAGMLPNTPRNLVAWLQQPQSIVPGNGMPDTGLTQQQARDIAAYLCTFD